MSNRKHDFLKFIDKVPQNPLDEYNRKRVYFIVADAADALARELGESELGIILRHYFPAFPEDEKTGDQISMLLNIPYTSVQNKLRKARGFILNNQNQTFSMIRKKLGECIRNVSPRDIPKPEDTSVDDLLG